MRYSGIQPQYFPRLHYFARILNADIFMIRDDVQHVRKHKYSDGKTDKSYQVHSPIKQSFGMHLLSVPIKNKFALISETKISYDNDWISNHIKTLQFAYGRAPYFQENIKEIEYILNQKFETIADLNISTILWATIKLLGEQNITLEKLSLEYVNSRLKDSSFRLSTIAKASKTQTMKENNLENPNEKIITLCKEMGATEDYCGGTAKSAYMDEDLYKKNNIKIIIQDWKCQSYPQLFNQQQGFIPNLSIIDMLMNTDVKEARNIIASVD